MYFFSLLLAVLLLAFPIYNFHAQTTKTAFSYVEIPDEFTKTNEEIRITVVGDLMCHSPQFKHALNAQNEYDFYPVFEPIADYIASADLAIGNLETVLAGKTKTFSGYPRFNTPNSYADALKKVGFDLIVTANNHSYDQQEKGVLRTLTQLENRKLKTVGTYRNTQARNKTHIITHNNLKISVLAYTQFSNLNVPKSKQYLVNPIDTALVRQDIQNARKAGAEIVLVHYHWGSEYIREPNQRQRAITEQTIKLGADLIIGGHPHYLQPIDFYKSENNAILDSGVVAYSLGNFFSNQRKRYRDAGVMLSIILEKNQSTGKVKVKKVEYVPTWVFKGEIEGKTQYRILPSQLAEQDKLPFRLGKDLLSKTTYMKATDWAKIKQAYADSKYILSHYDKSISVTDWKEYKPLIISKLDAKELPKTAQNTAFPDLKTKPKAAEKKPSKKRKKKKKK